MLGLYRALFRAGIDPATCRFDRVGGVRQRFEALGTGQADAAILVPPFIDLAMAMGCKKLWDGHDPAPDYPGVVVAARQAWIDANLTTARSYLRGLTLANAWASAVANREEAKAVLTQTGYAAAAAARLVRDAVPGLAPSRAGFDESVALRREAGPSTTDGQSVPSSGP